ncbi:hypothetical protein E2C01_084488 [Portunus trituberculatus]|uniref:Uncharacterized protein n=1 Tax=Portunus trituberculatus TaxID=210409 RepID=A0A5B7J6F2_PORTR|nr:hypothetical protein [Portunus trituberculatus]
MGCGRSYFRPSLEVLSTLTTFRCRCLRK